MLNTAITEEVINQIRKEIQLDEQGRGFISIRGTARLANVDEQAIRSAFRGAEQKPSKLAEFLIQNGFEGAEQNAWRQSAIPDLALALILEYYGYEAQERYRQEQAKAACRVFRAIGVRTWMQQVKGWQYSVESGVLQPPSSIDANLYRKILSNVTEEAKESINKIAHLTSHKHTHLHKLGQLQLEKTPATVEEAQLAIAQILIDTFDSLNKIVGNAVSQHNRLYNLGKKQLIELVGETQAARSELLGLSQAMLPSNMVYLRAKDSRKIVEDFLEQLEAMSETQRQELLLSMPDLTPKERALCKWSSRLVNRYLGLVPGYDRTVSEIMKQRGFRQAVGYF